MALIKNRLSTLVAVVERGEEVLIARDGVPVARTLTDEQAPIKPPGAWKGLVAHSPDWNSAETQAQIEGLFLGDGDAT
jgi:antitoxin (DNA-binding transcriptional repressor) of toxin-antitoxin stability system